MLEFSLIITEVYDLLVSPGLLLILMRAELFGRKYFLTPANISLCSKDEFGNDFARTSRSNYRIYGGIVDYTEPSLYATKVKLGADAMRSEARQVSKNLDLALVL